MEIYSQTQTTRASRLLAYYLAADSIASRQSGSACRQDTSNVKQVLCRLTLATTTIGQESVLTFKMNAPIAVCALVVQLVIVTAARTIVVDSLPFNLIPRPFTDSMLPDIQHAGPHIEHLGNVIEMNTYLPALHIKHLRTRFNIYTRNATTEGITFSPNTYIANSVSVCSTVEYLCLPAFANRHHPRSMLPSLGLHQLWTVPI